MNRADSREWLKDGTVDFDGGMDEGRPPHAIDKDQSAFGINVSFRHGELKPRPGVKQRKLTFAQGAKTPFENGFFHPAAMIYKGDEYDALLTSHGGRQFKINLDTQPGALATTTADFGVPAVNANVNVSLDTTVKLESQSTTIRIGGKDFTLVSVNSLTQITVKNTQAAYVGDTVLNQSDVLIPNTWSVEEITPTKSYDTETTAVFVMPAVGSTVNVAVEDATYMLEEKPVIKIGAYEVLLVSVNSPIQITIQNNTLAYVGVNVAAETTVYFTGYDKNNPNNRLNWSIQAENFWILQDNQSYPVIFDGDKSARSDDAKQQVPIGNRMCYAMARIAVALPNEMSYRIGDLLFGQGNRDDILYFTENNYLNEGGDFVARVFGAPSNAGRIKAMKAAAMTDNQLGQGPLVVGTPNNIFSASLPFDRTAWKSLNNPLVTANPIIGFRGQNSVVSINTDLWYRASDGWRSFITAMRQFNGSWGNTPQSTEIHDILDGDTEAWLEYGSAAYFEKRLIATVSPQMSPNGVYHRGLVVLDFEPNNSLRKKKDPAWQGIWTGLRVLQIVEGIVGEEPRLFYIVLNSSSKIELWEQTKFDKDDDGTAIDWEWHSRGYDCGDLDQFKKLKAGRGIVTGLWGDASLAFSWRSDETSCWNAWYTKTLCARKEDCATYDDCSGPITYKEQTRYPIRLPEPPDGFDSLTKKKSSTGYEFEVKIAGSGYCQLKQFRIYCLPEPENLGVEDETAT